MSMPWEMTWNAPAQANAPQEATPDAQQPWNIQWGGVTPAPTKTPSFGMIDPEDAAKSLGIGTAKGAIGIAGLPADLGSIGAQGIDKAASFVSNAFGQPYQSPMPSDGKTWSGVNLPGSQEIQKGIEAYTGPFYQPKTEAGKVFEKVGEFAPASMIGPGGLMAKFGRQAVMPALGAEAGRNLTDSPWGEFGGAVAGSIFNPARLVTPAPSSAERQVLANTLKQEGIPLTAGQATGNKPLRWAESVSGDIPFGSGKAGSIAENQKEQFTAAALRRVGEKEATRATPDVIDRNLTRIGKNFDDLAARNSMNADQQFAHDISNAQREYDYLANPLQKEVLHNVVDDVIKRVQANNGSIPGDQYQAMRSRLDKAARSARGKDNELSDALFGIRNSLDDAMERSMIANGRASDAEAWKTARNEYRNMLVLEKAATSAGENAAEGLISPSALRGAVVNQNRRAYARGQGDYADLARAGAGVLGDLPQSGTAPRESMREIFQIISPLLGAEAGSHVAGGAGVLAGGATALGAPALMSHLLMSGPVQRYLGNQLLGESANMTPQRRLMMVQELMRTQPQQTGQ